MVVWELNIRGVVFRRKCGPFPLNSWAVLAACVYTLCTECIEEHDVVLVVCTMDTAPIFNDVISEYI